MNGLIDIRHPRPGDVIASRFLLAGLGSGFEADLYYRVATSSGEMIAEGRMQGGAFSMRDFHTVVELDPGDVPTQDGVVEVFWESPAGPEEDPDGPEKDNVEVPVTFGFNVMTDFAGIIRYEVSEGDTLTSIAAQHFADVAADQIFESNRDVLSDPDRIYPGQVLRIPASL